LRLLTLGLNFRDYDQVAIQDLPTIIMAVGDLDRFSSDLYT